MARTTQEIEWTYEPEINGSYPMTIDVTLECDVDDDDGVTVQFAKVNGQRIIGGWLKPLELAITMAAQDNQAVIDEAMELHCNEVPAAAAE